MNNLININNVITRIESMKARSAWDKGVKAEAIDMLETLEYNDQPAEFESLDDLLNAILAGADNFEHWAYAGCGLVYNEDIAKRYCTPSELKRTHGGWFDPNPRETWIDLYARRAVPQAVKLIVRTVRIVRAVSK